LKVAEANEDKEHNVINTGGIMPKIKTHRATAKRFTITANGKIKRHHAKAAHIKTKKSPSLKRNLRQGEIVATVDAPRIKRLLNV